VIDHCECSDGRILRITIDIAFSTYPITPELQSTHEISGIESPALTHHIPCMAHVIQLALGAFMFRLNVNGHTKSREAHEHNQQFGENEGIHIGKSQRLWTEGNALINTMLAMGLGLVQTIGNERISRYFESPETDPHIAKNACSIHYADTWLVKWVNWISQSHSLHRGATYSGCEDRLHFDNSVAWTSLPITIMHLHVDVEYKIQ